MVMRNGKFNFLTLPNFMYLQYGRKNLPFRGSFSPNVNGNIFHAYYKVNTILYKIWECHKATFSLH